MCISCDRSIALPQAGEGRGFATFPWSSCALKAIALSKTVITMTEAPTARFIPAWGNPPGIEGEGEKGLKARAIAVADDRVMGRAFSPGY